MFVQQRTNALSSRLFEGQLQVHVSKEPQSDIEIVKTMLYFDSHFSI